MASKNEQSFNFEKNIFAPELDRLARMEKRVMTVENSFEIVRGIIKRQVFEDKRKKNSN